MLLLLATPPILGPLPGRRQSWGTNQDEVTIAERGGVNPRRLGVAQTACSFELSNAGQLSCFATLQSIQDAGLPNDLRGMWLTWESPIGKWGGVITGRPVTDGVAEIAAMSFAVLLRGRVIQPNFRPVAAPAGALVRRVLQEVIRDQPSYIITGDLDESGPPMSMSFEAADVFNDVLPALANDSGHEWTVSPDRVFTFSRYVGDDLSNSVRLVEGRHIAGYRVGDDMWLLANSLTGVSASAEIDEKEYMAQGIIGYTTTERRVIRYKRGPRKGKKKRVVKPQPVPEIGDIPLTKTTIDPYVVLGAVNTQSVAKYGPLEAVRTYSDTRDMGTIEARLTRELDAILNQPVALEMTLVDIDNCYRRFQEGDIVWVDIGSAGLSGALRVIHRSYDSGGLRIAGDLRPVGQRL